MTREPGEWEYYLTETSVPGYESGYFKTEPLQGQSGQDEVPDNGYVKNTSVTCYALPSTGGPGRELFGMLGSLLMCLSAMIYAYQMMKSRDEQV